MRSSRPSITELQPVVQPDRLMQRRSAEHWAGRLYMRRVSLHVTRLLVGTRVTPNTLTVLMIVVGVLGAAVASLPALWSALVAMLLVQAYLLLDCVDGEVARWRRTTSAAGVFLDRVGHHTVEAALLIGLGLRAGGGPTAVGGWAFAGALGAVGVLLAKGQTDLVMLARASSDLPTDVEPDPLPRARGLRSLRQLAARLPIHRLVGAIELTLALVVAALVDAASGSLVGTRALTAVATAVSLAVAIGHPIMILSSDRLR
jgi:phosphatidylglycerophosphate synthase